MYWDWWCIQECVYGLAFFKGNNVCVFEYKLHCWRYTDSDRLANFTVTVSDQPWPVTIDQLNSPQFTRCGQYRGTPPGAATVTIACSRKDTKGRYVYIHSPNDERILSLCEAVVVGSELLTMYRVMSTETQFDYHLSEIQIKLNAGGAHLGDQAKGHLDELQKAELLARVNWYLQSSLNTLLNKSQ